MVAKGGGTLVTSVYGDDADWLGDLLAKTAATTGRIYVGSAESAEAAPGSASSFPLLHGGPGRAGGGAELGGFRGLELYMQRVASRAVGRSLNDSRADPGRRCAVVVSGGAVGPAACSSPSRSAPP